MGLFSFLFGIMEYTKEEEEKRKKQRLEEEMDLHHLDEYEKEEVRKGNYDVYNFEDSSDEELDEDDYYYDDRR